MTGKDQRLFDSVIASCPFIAVSILSTTACWVVGVYEVADGLYGRYQ
jgi:hypothetical protein